MFTRSIKIAAVICFAATGVHAQEVIAQYSTWLGPQDIVNSSNQRLTSFGAVLAQDRANFHRFGRRDQYDSTDPIFGSSDMRAKLPALYAAGIEVQQYIYDDVMSGRGHYVFVRIMGSGGVITHVDVHEGAG